LIQINKTSVTEHKSDCSTKEEMPQNTCPEKLEKSLENLCQNRRPCESTLVSNERVKNEKP
jgi:hypothetical protein